MRWFCAFLLSLYLIVCSHAAVTIDVKTGDTGFGGANATTWSTTGTSGSNTLFTTAGGLSSGDTFLLIFVATQNASPTITMTWDSGGTNQSMTQIGSYQADDQGFLTLGVFGLVNPTSGDKTFAFTSTGGSNISFFGVALKGSVTTSVAAATEGFNGANPGADASSLSFNSSSAINTGDLAFAAWIYGTGPLTLTDGGTLDDSGGCNSCGWEHQSGAGSTLTASATQGGTDRFGGIIVGVKAPAAAAACGSRPLLGVGC